MMKSNYKRTQYEDITLDFSCLRKTTARYSNEVDPVNDNDLIRALPPIRTRAEYNSDIKKVPVVNPEDRLKSKMERRRLVYQLYDYRTAQRFGHSVDAEIADALRSGYRLSIKKKDADLEYGIKDNNYNPYFKIEGKTTAFALIGPSGVGKTTTLLSSLNYYPQVIVHEGESERYNQIVYIKVECPPGGSMKSFYDSCLAEMERALDYKIPDKHRYKTLDAKELLFKELADKWHLGLLVIDEIQNLVEIQDKKIMNQFLKLSNDLSVPIVFAGTEKVKSFFANSEYFLQRRIGVEINAEPYDYEDMLWEKLLEEIWEYQWMREYVPLTPAIKNIFYLETGGIIDRVVSLFVKVQLVAINNGFDDPENFSLERIVTTSEENFGSSRENIARIIKQTMASKSRNKTGSKKSETEKDSLFVQTPEIRKQMKENEIFLLDFYNENDKEKYEELKKYVNDEAIAAMSLSGFECKVSDITTAFKKAIRGKDIATIKRKKLLADVMSIIWAEVASENDTSGTNKTKDDTSEIGKIIETAKSTASIKDFIENLPRFAEVG